MFSVHKFKVYVSVCSNIHADAALGCNCPLPRGAAASRGCFSFVAASLFFCQAKYFCFLIPQGDPVNKRLFFQSPLAKRLFRDYFLLGALVRAPPKTARPHTVLLRTNIFFWLSLSDSGMLLSNYVPCDQFFQKICALCTSCNMY